MSKPDRVVLVAEDDDQIREVARIALEEGLGIRVVEAADGEEALWRVRDDRPAVVIMDLMLPKVLGWEVVRRIRADPETSSIPIIALSATGDRWGALQAGCNDYLNKPFLIDQLVGLTKRWLKGPAAGA